MKNKTIYLNWAQAGLVNKCLQGWADMFADSDPIDWSLLGHINFVTAHELHVKELKRHEITTWQKSDFCICGTNREIKTSKTEVNTSTCSFSSKYKNIDLQSYELYETSKNSPLKCCMSDILAKNKLQIKYKKNRDAQIWYLDGRHVQRELKKLDWTSALIHLATQQWEIQVELI